MTQASNVLSFPHRARPAEHPVPRTDEGQTELRAYLKDIIDIAYEGLLTNKEAAAVERIARLFGCKLK